MKQRCLNKNREGYKKWGGRGITVCKRWMKFENFYKDMGERPEGMTIDRIDNSKGYHKSNCKWATPKEQSNNTRKNVFITYNGKTQTIAQWSEELGISYHTIYARLRKGWEIERVLKFN